MTRPTRCCRVRSARPISSADEVDRDAGVCPAWWPATRPFPGCSGRRPGAARVLPSAAFYGPSPLDAARPPGAGVLAPRPPTRNSALGMRPRGQSEWTISACQTGNHAVHPLDVRQYQRGYRPRMNRRPVSTSRKDCPRTRPASLRRKSRSTVMTCETFATESLGSPVDFAGRRTFPGASSNRRLAVITTAMTV